MKLTLEFNKNIPQYSSDCCMNCNSEIGTSLCKIKNRGCCFYFPKFTLLDIQNMLLDDEGVNVLNMILSHPNTIIRKYELHSVGFFDTSAYDAYISNNDENDLAFSDKTLYFKCCPFVVDGKGCSIPSRFRAPTCNFFICNEIKLKISNPLLTDSYLLEAYNYSKWHKYENESLKHILITHNINLESDLEKSLDILKNQSLNIYDFPSLPILYF